MITILQKHPLYAEPEHKNSESIGYFTNRHIGRQEITWLLQNVVKVKLLLCAEREMGTKKKPSPILCKA